MRATYFKTGFTSTLPNLDRAYATPDDFSRLGFLELYVFNKGISSLNSLISDSAITPQSYFTYLPDAVSFSGNFGAGMNLNATDDTKDITVLWSGSTTLGSNSIAFGNITRDTSTTRSSGWSLFLYHGLDKMELLLSKSAAAQKSTKGIISTAGFDANTTLNVAVSVNKSTGVINVVTLINGKVTRDSFNDGTGYEGSGGVIKLGSSWNQSFGTDVQTVKKVGTSYKYYDITELESLLNSFVTL